ncbi:hypothetical protein T439DRAFT_325789 [Meredithblackwellia eburnea MCA 4105]
MSGSIKRQAGVICRVCRPRLSLTQNHGSAPARFLSSSSSCQESTPLQPPSTSSSVSPPASNAPLPNINTNSRSKTPHPSMVAAQQLLNALAQSSKTRAQALTESIKALELERKLQEMGGKINKATGYEEIEVLRKDVSHRESALSVARESATSSKNTYAAAVAARANSQKEVNDLLQRKSTWSSADVIRFTELVQQDHENERTETRAKAAMDADEEAVEKGFSNLMKAILERYHEEQVWSDKIRSLSTYGSLAITGLNVFLFILTILLIEPWRRKRLVEGVETRLRENTNATSQATTSSIASLHSLVASSQEKIDLLYEASQTPSSTGEDGERHESQGSDDSALVPFSEGDPRSDNPGPLNNSRGGDRERELLLVGAAGAVAGVGISILLGIIGFGQ